MSDLQPQAKPRPRVLVLAPRFPYPIIGGDRLRLHNLCVALSQRYSLTLLSLCEDSAAADVPPGVFDRIETVRLPRWQSRLNCLFALPTRLPLQLAYFWSREFADKVAELAPGHDAILCHLVRSAEYARPYDMPKVLEMTDAISLNYKRVRETGAPTRLRKLIYTLEQSRLEAFEREIVDEFDTAVLVSQADRSFLFAEDPNRLGKVMVCSNGVDTSHLPYQFADRPDDRIAFIGNMTTLQNLDAAEWFAREVLPRIRAVRPAAVLEVVGYTSNAEKRRLGTIPGVKVVGQVPSIAEAVAGAGVGVCPMRLGAGVQNKLLEYMALGLPSVTTSVSLAGLEAKPGEHLLLAHTAEEMAAAVLRLLEDRTFARSLAEAARRYVEQHHVWSAKLDPLVRELDRLITMRRRKSRPAALARARSAPPVPSLRRALWPR